ncbi:MAG: hypothetical protein ABIP51_03185 [Bacteroidia bacterium]
MNKTKLLSIAVVSLLLLNLGTMSLMIFNNKPSHPGHPPMGEGPKQLIIERLNFDIEQQKQYGLLVDEHRTKMKALNKASREMHDELYSQLKNTTIEKSKADFIIQKISENQTALDNLNFDHFQKIKTICKSDQLERYNALVEDLTQLFSPHGHGPPPK